MKFLDIAIVIPTLNEEKYIGILLDSIASQTVWPKEIVVVDAKSRDKTISEIKKRQKKLLQLKYFQIPKYTISRQRNFGASKTKSENILFLDADVELRDSKTLEKYLEEVNLEKVDIAVVHNYPLSSYWKDIVYFFVIRSFYEMLKNIWPTAQGINMFVKRKLFNKVKGFDEEVRVGEDMEFLQRVVKAEGKFKILKQSKVYTSVRRFEKEGRRKFTLKMLKGFYEVQRYGFRNIKIKYELGNHERDI